MRSAALSACALLSTALLLAACADGGTDSDGTADSGGSGGSSGAATADNASTDLGPVTHSPADLAIASDAVPGLTLQAVSQEEIDELTVSDAELIRAMSVDPSACTRVHQAPVDEDTPPGAVSVNVGTIDDQQVRLYVFADSSFVEELTILTDDCSDSTIEYSPHEGGATTRVDVTSTPVDTEAPEGVAAFTPVEQRSVATRAGESRESSSVSVSGVLREAGILVAVTTESPRPPESVVGRALEIFAAQAEKIRAAD